MGKSVSNIILKSTLQFLDHNGVETDSIIKNCHIGQYEVDKPGGRLSDKQHIRFMRETSEYGVLWRENHFSIDTSSQIVEYGYALFPDLIGFCLNQPSARDAIANYIKNRVIIGDCDHFSLAGDDNHLLVTYANDVNLPENNYSAIGNFMMLRELVRIYAPETRIKVGLIGRQHKGDEYINEYFGCHCCFEQAANFMLFEGASLSKPFELHHPLLYQNQKRDVEDKVARLSRRRCFSSLVMEVIESMLEKGVIDNEKSFMHHICSTLGMSRWVINERLKDENTHFTALLKDIRLRKACSLLTETRMSIQDISELLCFSSASVFSRFFSSNMGSSPLHYRKSRAGH